MAERVASGGYAALIKQTGPLTVGTPNVFVPYYKHAFTTDTGVNQDAPIYGNKFKTFQNIKGFRSHSGSIDWVAEPNSAAQLFDGLLSQQTTIGSGPYQHPFLLTTTDPNYYTYDFSLVSQVERFFGVVHEKITVGWNKEVMQFTTASSALGSFISRTVASVSGSTVTLAGDYDPVNATLGLVAGDLIYLQHSNGTGKLPLVVQAVTGGMTFTTTTAPTGIGAGDVVVLRPATVVGLNTLPTFTFPLTQYYFGATAAAALTASSTTANQTALETGVTMEIDHSFDNAKGATRSGSYDPQSLIRTTGGYTFKVKQFFDTPAIEQAWLASQKQAMVMRSFSGNGYELRFTANNMWADTNAISPESGKVIYNETSFSPQYDQADGLGMRVDVFNGLATI